MNFFQMSDYIVHLYLKQARSLWTILRTIGTSYGQPRGQQSCPEVDHELIPILPTARRQLQNNYFFFFFKRTIGSTQQRKLCLKVNSCCGGLEINSIELKLKVVVIHLIMNYSNIFQCVLFKLFIILFCNGQYGRCSIMLVHFLNIDPLRSISFCQFRL